MTNPPDEPTLEQHWSDRYAVAAVPDREVLLTAPLRAFLGRCLVEQSVPILLTDPDAGLSPFVTAMLREVGGHWVLWREGEEIVEARSGVALPSYESLWTDPIEVPTTAERTSGPAVLSFDLHLDHRAEERTVIGTAAADVLSWLGGGRASRWGTTEPLTETFTPAALTARARATMPDSEPLLVRTDERSFAYLVVARSGTGLRETLRGGVWLPDATDEQALATTTGAIERLGASRHRTLVATFSLLRADAPLTLRGPAPAERMLASYLGPAVLARTATGAAGLAERHGGVPVGRQRVPALHVTFPGTHQQAQGRYQALVDDLTQEVTA